MELTLSAFAVVVSMIALLVALIVHGEVQELKTQKKQNDPSERNRSGRARDRPKPSTAVRRQQAVSERQHRNFMEYDGTDQTPIDRNTILADSGK